MPLNCTSGNWEKFIQKYRRNDSQWYLMPKAKTYTEESVNLIIHGLRILNHWVGDQDSLSADEYKYLQHYLRDPQSLFPEHEVPLCWNAAIQVFITSHLFQKGILSRDQQDETLRETFENIIGAIVSGSNYYDLLASFGNELLISSFAANSRNFINICQKLGLAWIETNHLVTITSIGKSLIETESDYRPLLEQQLKRLQFYNPTFERSRNRYGHIKLFPFSFCLQVIMELTPTKITKNEFALFITKATSMKDVNKCVNWINKFRELSEEEQEAIIEKISRRQRGRTRPLLVEALETSSKNINFLTRCGPWRRDTIDSSEGIILEDRRRARELLSDCKDFHFVEYESKESWFCYYGDISRKSDIEAAIDYYARIGKVEEARKLTKKAKDVKAAEEKLKDRLYEKQIEDFYRDNLNLIEHGLSLHQEPSRNGQQYETPDGGIIDLLTVSSEKKYVVIEFKRDKTSDETVGQILRYFGWVRKHLSSDSEVRGYIVALDFDKFIKYALYGMQHPLIPNESGKDLIQLYRHTFDVKKMGIVNDSFI